MPQIAHGTTPKQIQIQQQVQQHFQRQQQVTPFSGPGASMYADTNYGLSNINCTSTWESLQHLRERYTNPPTWAWDNNPHYKGRYCSNSMVYMSPTKNKKCQSPTCGSDGGSITSTTTGTGTTSYAGGGISGGHGYGTNSTPNGYMTSRSSSATSGRRWTATISCRTKGRRARGTATAATSDK